VWNHYVLTLIFPFLHLFPSSVVVVVVVVVVFIEQPDWTNVDEYEQIRATMLNEQFGYVGFAADLYGPELQGVENRTIRGEQASLYRGNSTLFTSRIQAAVDVLKNHPAVLPDKIAIIGCT